MNSRIPGSFRDPSGFLFVRDGIVLRQVNRAFSEPYERMMDSGFYEAAVKRGLLIAHEEIDPGVGDTGVYKVLRPVQLDFISYPYEWSFSQLRDAASLTIELQKLAIEHGMNLRDASAYNVQFHRGRPVFIDTLSFEPYEEGRPWVAYQQFCKHFLAPLALMAHTHIELRRLLRVNIDGIPLDVAAAALPWRTRFRPSLLAHIHLHARAQSKHSDTRESADRANTATVSRNGMIGLVDSLGSAVRKLKWNPAGTEWGDYYEDTNYSDDASKSKAEVVTAMLDRIGPSQVWDLGGNTGVYSRLAADRGIPTLSFDIDPAAVEKNYRRAREQKEEMILPLIMDLTNPSPGVGWASRERNSLANRGPVDLVLALALVHHLAISNNVPLGMVAEMLASLGRHLVIEFVPKSDSQVQRLLATRPDIFPGYDEAGFERAFSEHFALLDQQPVAGSERTLYLLGPHQT